jgi:hypothetical protein
MRLRLIAFVAIVEACTVFGSSDESRSKGRTDPADAAAPGDSAILDSGGVPPDGATTTPGGCNGAPDCERVVFITTEEFLGDLGGIEGADAKCDAAAAASTLDRVRGRHYRAFIGDKTTPVGARMAHGTLPYIRTDGQRVQRSWDALMKLPLLTEISLSETGAAPATLAVWTGTKPDGLTGDWYCSGWRPTEATDNGIVGSAGRLDTGWIGDTALPRNCSLKAHLYCFEL